MPEKEEAVLMDKKSNVCCVFNDPDPNHAVRNMDYELLASEELPNERNYVYRCRRCGNYVLYNIWLDEPALPDFSEDQGHYSRYWRQEFLSSRLFKSIANNNIFLR